MNDLSRASTAGKRVWLLCAVSIAGLLGYAYYAQYRLYLDPCPLCITQRAFYLGIGIASLVGFFTWRRPGWQLSASVLMIVATVGGIITAGRQVWLQHLPPELVPECGPGLQYWLDNMPILETVSLLFKGDGNCAEVNWRFLGLSMGEWSLVCFVGFLLVGLAMAVMALRARRAS